MRKNIITKAMAVVSMLILSALGFINSVYATNINTANIYAVGDCGNLLTYKGIPVKVTYVEYINEGNHYPAYCMDKTKVGAETNSYNVSIEGAVNDVGLWRRIINGYPYKSIQELGVANAQEAFTATKQAIYCYIHGNNLSDYGAIGEAGQRTLNAMHTIINNAQNSKESKISSTIKINKNSDSWKQDENEKNYVSKVYSVSAGANIQNYKIILSRKNNQDIGGIKLTDIDNKTKTEFNPNEKFKILVPIKEMKEKGNFELKVEAKISTKPVLYGIAPNSSYQDYALTGATYEDGTGNIQDEYFKNETKIIILKQDEDTNEKLEGVEFELLDENKNVVYNGLKTDKDGKINIENIVPGRYYIKETNTKDGYLRFEDLIKIDINLNEQMTVTVNNKKEEKPKIETSKNTTEVSKKILPVTGM